MASKRILTTRAKAGMVTAENVYTENKLVIPKGTLLTDEIIESLKDYSVFAIRVETDENGMAPGEEQAGAADGGAETPEMVKTVESGQDIANVMPEVPVDIDGDSVVFINPVSDITEIGANGEREEYFSSIRETKEFQVFQSSFMESVDNLKTVFNSVVMKNKDIDKELLLTDVKKVVSNGRNSLHILDMLQCMRGYDDVTYVHCMNVALLSNMIGRIVYPDISHEELDVLTLSGLLCDIGKILVPEEVIMKKGRLTLPEYNIAKTHVFHGNNILKGLGLDPRIAEVAMRHHERCDGSGYPGGYRRNQIEEFARIVAIADTYDAMTSDRVYRAAMCPFDVIHMFEREGLVKYDVKFLLPFLEKAVQAYVNADVKLSTDEIGRIIMINRKELSRPVVKSGDNFYDLSKETSINIEKILL